MTNRRFGADEMLRDGMIDELATASLEKTLEGCKCVRKGEVACNICWQTVATA